MQRRIAAEAGRLSFLIRRVLKDQIGKALLFIAASTDAALDFDVDRIDLRLYATEIALDVAVELSLEVRDFTNLLGSEVLLSIIG